MKLTILAILNASPVLQKINTTDLAITVSLQLSKLRAELGLALEAAEKRRLEIFNKYAVLSDPKNKKSKKKIPKQHREKFNEFVDKLGKEEVEIEVIKMPLIDLEGVKISTLEVDLIDWLIEEPEEAG